jgi:hypothetical protein
MFQGNRILPNCERCYEPLSEPQTPDNNLPHQQNSVELSSEYNCLQVRGELKELRG